MSSHASLAAACKQPDRYAEVDAEIEKTSQTIQSLKAGYAVFVARAKLYTSKAQLAAEEEDTSTFESCIEMALNDYSEALGQGGSGELARVEWFTQRGRLHKAIADTLPAGARRKRHMSDALQNFSNASHSGHNTSAILYMRGEVRCALGQFDQAIHDYTHSIAGASIVGKIKALQGRSVIWRRMKEFTNAYNDLSQAIGICITQEKICQKDLANLLYARSVVGLSLGKNDQSFVDVGKALELIPDFKDALETRASLCYSFGLYTEAKNDLCDALNLGAGDSEVLSELYRKLLLTQAVTLHIKEGKKLSPSSAAPKPTDYYVHYCVRAASGPMRPLIEGRTLTSSSGKWDEQIQFELPSKSYTIELTVRDEYPESSAPFLGRCEINLSITPESQGDKWMALKPAMTRRNDTLLFEMMTGGQGTMALSWTTRARLPESKQGQRDGMASPKCVAAAQHEASFVVDGMDVAELFARHDVNKKGWVSRSVVRSIYEKQDTLGVPVEDVDAVLNKFKKPDDDHVTLEEFRMVMLRIIRR